MNNNENEEDILNQSPDQGNINQNPENNVIDINEGIENIDHQDGANQNNIVEVDVDNVEIVEIGVEEHNVILNVEEEQNTSAIGLKEKQAKRKRLSSPKSKIVVNYDDDDDGSTCPICLDSWEMCGPHRLTSLKCGHLFGSSCIKRWIQECTSTNRSCPSCKKRANMRDFRYLYAKKLACIDNSEEYRLRDELSTERLKYQKLEMEYSLINLNLKLEKQKNIELNDRLKNLEQVINSSDFLSGNSNLDSLNCRKQSFYKLFLEKNVVMGKDAGCRVLIYNTKMQSIIVSQKSSNALFRGYGVRLVDVNTYRPNSYLHLSEKMPRDLSLDEVDNLLVSASLENSTSIYNLHNRNAVVTIRPTLANEAQSILLWSCCFDIDRKNYLYLGTNTGATFVYDIRSPTEYVHQLMTLNDYTPVINIIAIKPNLNVHTGGFLVCKLRSVWFYQYQSEVDITQFQLSIEGGGSFISMSYERKSKQILLVTRPSSAHPQVRYIIGTLANHENNVIYFNIKTIINGSSSMQVMIRSTLINMENGQTLLAGYLEDTKMLALWNTELNKKSEKLYSLSVNSTVFGMQAFKYNNNHFLGGLTENEFKIYKIHEV